MPSDRISRTFTVRRGDYDIEYPLITFASVLDPAKNFSGDLQKVAAVLKSILLKGVPDRGDRQSVSQGSQLVIDTLPINYTPVELARAADYEGKGNRQHAIVQDYLVRNDELTLATEIPLWDDDWFGHLDLLRAVPHEKGYRFEIVDFKPKAHKEKKAATQVHRYCKLFSQQMEIDPKLVDGIYFDNSHAYKILPFAKDMSLLDSVVKSIKEDRKND